MKEYNNVKISNRLHTTFRKLQSVK